LAGAKASWDIASTIDGSLGIGRPARHADSAVEKVPRQPCGPDPFFAFSAEAAGIVPTMFQTEGR
jgi:hypothetical protein